MKTSETHAQPSDVKRHLDSGKACLIDVRSFEEFRSGHVPEAICLPLEQIEHEQHRIPRDKLVILSCQAGRRSAQASKRLREQGFRNIVEMEGGFSAWRAAGLPVRRLSATISIMRQVLLTAGAAVFFGSLLALTVNAKFVLVPLFFGAGLILAGASGWCGLGFLLERMPWNRAR